MPVSTSVPHSAGGVFFPLAGNVNGKVTDAWFMELSHKYEVERDELKKKLIELNQQLAKIREVREGKEHFLSCVRSFAEMKEVTPMILQELIEKIEVYAVEGTGLNRTQSVIIHYKFLGELDMPAPPRHRPGRTLGPNLDYTGVSL